MTRVQVAFYKGAPSLRDWVHVIGHNLTCLVLSFRRRQWVKYSHAEIVIDEICYSSSLRDGGTRAKVIDLDSGRWDVFEVPVTFDADECKDRALSMLGKQYDRRGAGAFAIPWVGENPNKLFCFEYVGISLGLPDAHLLDPLDLIRVLKG
jgi:hypothetical protein